MRTLSVDEASQNFASLIAEIENGAELTLERDGIPVATMTRVRRLRSKEEREAAWTKMLELLDRGLPLGGGPAPSKDEMHER